MINTLIGWCDDTNNLWWGCIKKHTGCKNCYAETTSKRWGKSLWGVSSKRERKVGAFPALKKLQRLAHKEGKQRTVFVGSMMDIFEESMPLTNPIDQYQTTGDLRDQFFNNIMDGMYPDLVFLCLTKRPENITEMLSKSFKDNMPSNVWFGTSVVDQPTYDKYLPYLQDVKANLFLSIEPQVAFIELKECDRIKWIIQGGESGSKRRPFLLSWAYSMKQQCKARRIPYFFKQIDKVIMPPEDLEKSKAFPDFNQKIY